MKFMNAWFFLAYRQQRPRRKTKVMSTWLTCCGNSQHGRMKVTKVQSYMICLGKSSRCLRDFLSLGNSCFRFIIHRFLVVNQWKISYLLPVRKVWFSSFIIFPSGQVKDLSSFSSLFSTWGNKLSRRCVNIETFNNI